MSTLKIILIVVALIIAIFGVIAFYKGVSNTKEEKDKIKDVQITAQSKANFKKGRRNRLGFRETFLELKKTKKLYWWISGIAAFFIASGLTGVTLFVIK